MLKDMRGFSFSAAGVGLILASVTIYLIVHGILTAAQEVHTQGVVIRDEGVPVIGFTGTDGRQYKVYGSASSSPKYHAGDQVTVLYPPDNPEAGEIDSFGERWVGAAITGALGLLFGGVGCGLLVADFRNQRTRRRVLRSGREVQAHVSRIYVDHSVTSNGKSPWVIVADYEDLNTEPLTFRSEFLWRDPSPFYPPESEVTVLYLETNPKKNVFKLDRLSGERSAVITASAGM